MPRRAKIVLVSAVLAAGLLLAWQFRKSPARATAKSNADAPARAEMAQQPTSQPRNATPPLDFFTAPQQQQQQTGPNDDATSRFAAASPGASPSSPPSAPPSEEKPAYTAPDHTAAAPTKPAEGAVPELPPNFSPGDHASHAAPSEIRNASLPDDTTAPTHKIVDGDSLPLLAERYLGSAARAGEIFACNRDVLSDPELLPIGARLRIPTGPQRPAVASAPSIGATSDAVPPATPPNAASPTQIAGETAKAPPLMDIGAPGLSPLPPIGQQTSSPGGIYIVQTGDTLQAIAQKVYGDSGRSDAILQANRQQLRSDQDLRAGMLLETP